MTSIHQDQRGVGALEIILIIVIVGIIGGVGWFVYHTKQNSDKTLDQATSTSQNAVPHFAKPKSSDTSTANPSSSTSQKSSTSSNSSSHETEPETNDDKSSR